METPEETQSQSERIIEMAEGALGLLDAASGEGEQPDAGSQEQPEDTPPTDEPAADDSPEETGDVVDDGEGSEAEDPDAGAPSEDGSPSEEEIQNDDDAVVVAQDELSKLVFKVGEDGEAVSLETLIRERMPREHFLKKNTELDKAKKDYEGALARLQQVDQQASSDTVGFISQLVDQGLAAGTIDANTANAFRTTIDFLEKNGIRDTTAINAAKLDQKQSDVQSEAAALESQREMLTASQDFLKEYGMLPDQLPEKTREQMFTFIQNKRMATNEPVSFVEAYEAIKTIDPSLAPKPTQKPKNGAPDAPASRTKVIEQLRKDSSPTAARPRGSTIPTETSHELAGQLIQAFGNS